MLKAPATEQLPEVLSSIDRAVDAPLMTVNSNPAHNTFMAMAITAMQRTALAERKRFEILGTISILILLWISYVIFTTILK